jgi:DNA-binding NarL/FixJ family response regulator
VTDDRPMMDRSVFDDMRPSVRRVARLCCIGYSNKAIAEELGINTSTVATHLTMLYELLTERGILRNEDSPRARLTYLIGVQDGTKQGRQGSG